MKMARRKKEERKKRNERKERILTIKVYKHTFRIIFEKENVGIVNTKMN